MSRPTGDARPRVDPAGLAWSEPPWPVLLGGRWAVSVPATVVVMALGVPFALMESRIDGAPPVAMLVIANLIGGVGLAGVLALASMTILRNRARTPAPVVIVVAVWLLASATRRLVSAAIVYLPRGALPFEPWVGVLSISASSIWLGILAFILARNDFYRQRSQMLARLNDELAAPRSALLAELHARRTELVAIVDNIIRPELARIVGQLRALPAEPSQQELVALSESVDAESRDLVRTVSQSIGERVPVATVPVPLAGTGVPVTWRDLLTIRISVTLTLLLKGSMSLPVVVLSGAGDWGSVVIAFVMSWAILVCGVIVWRLLRRPLGRWVVLVTYVTYALSQMIPLLLVHGLVLPAESAGGVVVFAIVGMFTGVIASLISQNVARNRDAAQRLTALTQDVMAFDAARAQDVGRLQRQIAELLHGPVQGRLATVAVALRLSAQQGGPDVADTASACHRLLEQAGEDISSLAKPAQVSDRSLRAQLADVQRQWKGFVDLDVVIDPLVEAVLNGDRDATAVVQATAAEAVTNASRHGGARHVTVHVEPGHAGPADAVAQTTSAGSTICVRVADDGRGPSREVQAGAGLSAIERAGGSWRLDPRSGGGCVLTVTLPLTRLVAAPEDERV